MGVSGANPALAAFLASFAETRDWAQVVIGRVGDGYEIRHIDDRAAPPGNLRSVDWRELRALTLENASGQFRPLKSAPDLRTGWRLSCANENALWRGLQELYPGSVPDWFAAENAAPPVTDYRPFTNRQTGMYRVTQFHTDEQAAVVIRSCCGRDFCLKRRLWSVHGLAPDSPEQKSAIPCLEPCAILLEFARKAARIQQEEPRMLELRPSELDSMIAAVEQAARRPAPEARAGDTGSALNPRRLQLLLEKLRPTVEREAPSKIEDTQ